MWVQSLGQEDPWRWKWQPTPVFLCGESHGQRSLVSGSQQGPKELNMTEATMHAHICLFNLNFQFGIFHIVILL